MLKESASDRSTCYVSGALPGFEAVQLRNSHIHRNRVRPAFLGVRIPFFFVNGYSICSSILLEGRYIVAAKKK